ncbi:Crp/Fnr family transcriptional regulator [Arthrobacter sp. H14]|uniref:Crp/Fnr family transcriptional regulator n=1 Tax=Arthrobacter sp. H14 TaxID=1312959 RepID=UPI00056579B8|nr:Crp/Fnr family transcriptional regulator [Arthrobacter sp. H14]
MTEACDLGGAIIQGGAEARPWAPQRREADTRMSEHPDRFSCLNEVDLFADLTQDEIQAMDMMVPARHYRRGELVFSQSDPATALFILKTGRVRVFRLAEDGSALTMAILEPGAVFGEMLLVGQRMYDNYAEAIDDATICRLSAADVERFLLSDPRIAIRISRLLGEQVSLLEQRLTDLALRPLEARVASTLLKLVDTTAHHGLSRAPVIKLTHNQLAGLLGATREATSKAMSELSAKNVIRQSRGRVVVLEPNALKAAARKTS